jgi:hypothetical protein
MDQAVQVVQKVQAVPDFESIENLTALGACDRTTGFNSLRVFTGFGTT